ncbi:unnamed protein product [Polarella glacialis]|uniref:Uncharacterized protein n=1 Tax=Polarella glacialis TaxID=89957 RepID=A0A813EP32_POLGL|nr:unnamed protein product [Polarella glacialis]
MAGYSGVLWPDGLLLAQQLLHLWVRGGWFVPEWKGRCLELAAGIFALPSLVLAGSGRFSEVVATDLPGIVGANHSSINNNNHGFRADSLDLCRARDVEGMGKFDVIASSGVCQTNCGPAALVGLSTVGTVVYMVVRSDAADLHRVDFLLRGYFRELFRLDLGQAGRIHPGEQAYFLIWQRQFGPHSCWSEGYTFATCCLDRQDTHSCFDQVFTREICCGSQSP